MQKTIETLRNKAMELSICTDNLHSKKDYLGVLSKYYLNKKSYKSWGLEQRLKIDCPQLSFDFKHLHQHEKEQLFNSQNWSVEQKYDGIRMLIFYNVKEGFTFFGRNISTKDFLPIEYSNKILINYKDSLILGKKLQGLFSHNFILDSECIVKRGTKINTTMIRKYGVKTKTDLTAVSSILSLKDDASRIIQTTQAKLHLVGFDILYYDKSFIYKLPYRERHKLLTKIYEQVKGHKISSILLSKRYFTNKQLFYTKVVKEGGEGVVFKNDDGHYIPTSSRNRKIQVKLKRTMSESLGNDMDVFISGFTESKKDKQWSNFIGGIKLSVIVNSCDKKQYEHWIATVSGIPLQTRKRLTIIVDNKPTLNKDYLNKVITINGQALSGRNNRFIHAIVPDWTNAFREDKNYLECIVEENLLKKLISS